MRALAVVEAQPGTQRLGPPLRAGVRRGVRPLPRQCLDETLGLAIGLWPIRPGPRESQARLRRGRLKPVDTLDRLSNISPALLHDRGFVM